MPALSLPISSAAGSATAGDVSFKVAGHCYDCLLLLDLCTGMPDL
jgi:hypothetical protein